MFVDLNLLMFHQVQLQKKVRLIFHFIIIFILINLSGLITPDSWKTYPVVFKKPVNKKPVKIDEESKPIVEKSAVEKKPRTEKPKRDRSLFCIT